MIGDDSEDDVTCRNCGADITGMCDCPECEDELCGQCADSECQFRRYDFDLVNTAAVSHGDRLVIVRDWRLMNESRNPPY